MKNRKGFTLVELLAVIAILAILVLIALPNVIFMFGQAKRNTFVTEVQSIYSTGETQFVSDSMGDMTEYPEGISYGRKSGARNKSDGYKLLDLQGTNSIDYYIHFNLA
jgi:prepilin-type N-terminal cleavage/methylation domain-containing protein